MKKELTNVSGRFFDSKDVYEDLGVPWKRGLIFYGPAGNGKTISIKALMHTLADRKDSVPTLYVRIISLLTSPTPRLPFRENYQAPYAAHEARGKHLLTSSL